MDKLEYDERQRLYRFCYYFEQCYDAASRYYGEKSLPLPNAAAVAAFCADSFRARERRDGYDLRAARVQAKFGKLHPDVRFDADALVDFYMVRNRAGGPARVSLLVERYNGYAKRIRENYRGLLVDGTKAPPPGEWTDETYAKVDPESVVKCHRCGKGTVNWLKMAAAEVRAYAEFCESDAGDVKWLCEHAEERSAL